MTVTADPLSQFSLDRADLPALYKAADTASGVGQRRYLSLQCANLIALVIGALLTAVSLENALAMQVLRGVGALLLGVSFLLTLAISLKNYEQRWYGGRAAAESVKTSAWRYVTGAEPYQISLKPSEADRQFVGNLHEILEEGDQLSVSLGGLSAAEEQITGKMREVRGLSLPARKDIYLQKRIADQREWYSGKSADSEEAEGKYFKLVMAAQFAALAFAIVLVAMPLSRINLAGVFSTAAAALLAWMQIKRHQELAQSYGVAAHELGLISAQAPHINTEEEFSVFVADAETAISREHTLWIARRDRLPPASGFRR